MLARALRVPHALFPAAALALLLLPAAAPASKGPAPVKPEVRGSSPEAPPDRARLVAGFCAISNGPESLKMSQPQKQAYFDLQHDLGVAFPDVPARAEFWDLVLQRPDCNLRRVEQMHNVVFRSLPVLVVPRVAKAIIDRSVLIEGAVAKKAQASPEAAVLIGSLGVALDWLGEIAGHDPHFELHTLFSPEQMKRVYASVDLEPDATDKARRWKLIVDTYDRAHVEGSTRLFAGTIFPDLALGRLLAEQRLLVFDNVEQMRTSSCVPCQAMANTVLQQVANMKRQLDLPGAVVAVAVNAGFRDRVLALLERLAATNSGKAYWGALYKATASHAHQVAIYGVQPVGTLPEALQSALAEVFVSLQLTADPVATADSRMQAQVRLPSGRGLDPTAPITPGTGCNSFLPLQPGYLTGEMSEPVFSAAGGGSLIATPPELLIAHELFHSLHHVSGLLTGEDNKGIPDEALLSLAFSNLEEQRTIAGEAFYRELQQLEHDLYLNGRMSFENLLRRELGGAERFGHIGALATLEETRVALGKKLKLPLESLMEMQRGPKGPRLPTLQELGTWFGGLGRIRYSDLQAGDILFQREYGASPSGTVSAILSAQKKFKHASMGSPHSFHVSLVVEATPAYVVTGEMVQTGVHLAKIYIKSDGEEVFPEGHDEFDLVAYRPTSKQAAIAAAKAVAAIGKSKMPYSKAHCLSTVYGSSVSCPASRSRATAFSSYVSHWAPALEPPQLQSLLTAKEFAPLLKEGMQCSELIVYAFQVGDAYVDLNAPSTAPVRLEHYLNMHVDRFQYLGVLPAAHRGGSAPPSRPTYGVDLAPGCESKYQDGED